MATRDRLRVDQRVWRIAAIPSLVFHASHAVAVALKLEPKAAVLFYALNSRCRPRGLALPRKVRERQDKTGEDPSRIHSTNRSLHYPRHHLVSDASPSDLPLPSKLPVLN